MNAANFNYLLETHSLQNKSAIFLGKLTIAKDRH